MKQSILILFLIVTFFSCNSIKKTVSKENNFEKICDIEIDRIPTFEFLNNKDLNEKSIIENQLFESLTVLKIYSDLNAKKDDKEQDYYYEISKHYNKDINRNRFNDKENKYVFYKFKNDNFRLVSAEITFNSDLIFNDDVFIEPIGNENTKKYRETANLFKVKHNNFLIDIGMEKKEFAKIFNKDYDKLCDTINVHNDTDESWYLFKKNILDKIIIDSYID